MKIGVALSGCDIGGVSAYIALKTLKDMGLSVDMISASGLASVGALLFAAGYGQSDAEKRIDEFLITNMEKDLDTAIAGLAENIKGHRLEEIQGLAVHALNISDGKTVTFTNDYRFQTDTLSTFPIEDAYDIISATVGAVDGLTCYPYEGYRLSDYSVRYGCPVYPLQMFGADHIISLTFLPLVPSCAYELLMSQILEHPNYCPGVHIPLKFPGQGSVVTTRQYAEIATSNLESCKNQIYLLLASSRAETATRRIG